MRRKTIGLAAMAALLLGGCLPAVGAAASPTGTIQGSIDIIVEILNDPQYFNVEQRSAQRQKIWDTARPLFDFAEISRRTVGQDWQRFTAEEQTRFADVFSRFLGDTYIDKLQSEYHNETVRFDSEIVREPLALVRTQLIRQGTTIPIDYRMKLTDGAWRIYDILVENGVSLVKNYRVQFQSVLQKETPAQLIERLEQKMVEPGSEIDINSGK